MIVLSFDGRNITTTTDLLQEKMLVALLRLASSFAIYRRLLVDAAEEVNRDGFKLTGDDVRIAAEQFGAVFGFRTDMCKAATPDVPASPPVPEPPEGEKTVN